jgi:hypothetical protein
MPGLDGMGPRGKGPMTGGGEGFCIVPLGNEEQQVSYLRNCAGRMQEHLKNIKKRIKELERSNKPGAR